MLRNERRRLTANVTEGLTPYVQAFEARYGALPDGFWQDEYVLGFLAKLAGLFAKTVSRGQVSAAERKAVVRDCLETLSGAFAPQVALDLARLKRSPSGDFATASRAAEKVVAFSLGKSLPDDPVVLKARGIAGQVPGFPSINPGGDFAVVARALVNMLYYDLVNQRLMANFQLPETDETALPAPTPFVTRF